MPHSELSFQRPMRWVLLCCGPMNLAGAISFSPLLSSGRRSVGLPEPDPFYLRVLSAWVLAFGVAYFYQGWTGQVNLTVLALGAWGKFVFAALLIQHGFTNDMRTFAITAALPDLILALLFAAWLWNYGRLAAR
jgi:hypothetical protein